MKTSLLFPALLSCAVVASAQYSSVQPPSVYPLLTNPPAIPFIANGGGTAPGPSTNLSGLDVRLTFPIGEGGYALSINCSGTNTTTTTNMTIVIEHSANGTDWATNSLVTWVVGPLGTQYAPVGTNAPQTEAGGVMGNFAMGRVRSLHHTNTGSLFITNLNVSTRLLTRPKRGK